MKNDKHLSQTATAIAKSIVDLVERTDGPVTFARIAHEIPGFAKKEPPTWEYVINRANGEMLVWEGMTEDGLWALRSVMSGRRVAAQYVNLLPYILEDRVPNNENWQPIVLLPKSAGNLDTRNWLMRASPGFRKYALARAAKEGITSYRPITPRRVGFTADQFSP
jgi:hypothetical protein